MIKGSGSDSDPFKVFLDEYNRDLRVQCPECNQGHKFEGVEGQYRGVEKLGTKIEEE